VDDFALKIVNKAAYAAVPWHGCCWFCIVVGMILAIIASFARPDFLTQGALFLGIMGLTNLSAMRRSNFRQIVKMLIVSVLYDLIWFIYNNVNEDGNDDAREGKVKDFALRVSYISFFFKVSSSATTLSLSYLCFFNFVDHHSDHFLESFSRLHIYRAVESWQDASGSSIRDG